MRGFRDAPRQVVTGNRIGARAKLGSEPVNLRVRSRVPLARRQLLSEPAKLLATIGVVGAACALVLLLLGLRQGIAQQVSVYVDHQTTTPLLVARQGTQNFLLGRTSVLPIAVAEEIRKVPGVAHVVPVANEYAMFNLHGRKVLTLLIGYDPALGGGPWNVAAGRAPRRLGELALDRVLAVEHGLGIDSALALRGTTFRIVGLTGGTSAWMTPLAFATLDSVNALDRAPRTATAFLVAPRRGVDLAALSSTIERSVPGVDAHATTTVARNDQRLWMGVFDGPLLLMVAIGAAVALLVIALAVYTSTVDRAREYAALAAIGLSRRGLLRIVVTQATVLALGGVAAGVLLALAGGELIPRLAPKYLIVVDARSAILLALASLAMALVAAVFPARFLSRLDPAVALRR